MTTGLEAPPRAPRRTPVDPRLRERRLEVRRAEGRRRLRVVLVAGVVVLAVAVAFLAVESPLLAVERVQVRGAHRLTPAEVRRAARVGHHAPVLLLDSGAVAARVERVPWVGRATVTRVLPHTVRIAVIERVPAGWVPAPGGVALVDASGRVLADVPAPPPGLPQLAGFGAAPAPGGRIGAAAAAVGVLGALPPPLQGRVATLTWQGGAVTLALRAPAGTGAPAGEVRLGPPTEVPAKLAAAATVLGELRGQRVGYVDVSVPSTPATG